MTPEEKEIQEAIKRAEELLRRCNHQIAKVDETIRVMDETRDKILVHKTECELARTEVERSLHGLTETLRAMIVKRAMGLSEGGNT